MPDSSFVCGEGPRGAGGNGHPNLAARRRAAIVYAGDRDFRCLLARVHEPQPTDLVGVATRVEDRHPVVAVHVRRYDIVHRREKPVLRRADVGQHLDVQIARQRQPPVAVAGPGSLGQALLRVALLHILRVEMNRLIRVDVQRDRAETRSGVVDRLDADLARPRRVVDDPHEALANLVGSGGEHRGNLVHNSDRLLPNRRHGGEHRSQRPKRPETGRRRIMEVRFASRGHGSLQNLFSAHRRAWVCLRRILVVRLAVRGR